MRGTTRKRLEWLGLMLLGPYGGDVHANRWPTRFNMVGRTGHCWKADPEDEQNARRLRRGRR